MEKYKAIMTRQSSFDIVTEIQNRMTIKLKDKFLTKKAQPRTISKSDAIALLGFITDNEMDTILNRFLESDLAKLRHLGWKNYK